MPVYITGIIAAVGIGVGANSASQAKKAQQGASAKNDALAQQQFEEDKRRYDLNREDQERWGMMTIQGEEEFDRRNRADKEKAYQRGFDLNKNNINRGEIAGNQLAFRMGLGPKRGGKAATAATGATGGTFDAAQYLAQNPDVAADAYASQNPEWHYNTMGKAEGRARPVVAGTGTPGTPATAAVEATEADNIGYGGLNERFKDFKFETDPGYQFRMEEGQTGVNNKMAASGNLLSGAAMKALTRFNQDYASNELGNAYGRYSNDRQSFYGANSDEYSRLSGVQGAGQNAINSTNGLAGTVQGSYSGGGAASGLAGASAQFQKSSDNYYNNMMGSNNASANAQSAYNNAFGNALGGGLGSIAAAWKGYQNNNKGTSGYNYSGTSNNPYAGNYENSFDLFN